MRQPSINPPSFYDDVAPPPLLTPPPNYDDLSPRVEIPTGYFNFGSNGSNSDETSDPELEAEGYSETHLEQETEPEEDAEEECIVDMVGLEDLSLGVRTRAPMGRRSGDTHCGIWSL